MEGTFETKPQNQESRRAPDMPFSFLELCEPQLPLHQEVMFPPPSAGTAKATEMSQDTLVCGPSWVG